MALRTGDVLRRIFKHSRAWHPLSDSELKELKQVMLEISDDFVSFCQEHKLEYCMAYGTALGAVRHKGYIPWDDDVDFFMPRADYNRFMILAEEELKDKYVIRSVTKGDKVNFPTLHMRLKNTLYINYGDLIITKNENREDRGIYIDIAPLDDASDNDLIRNCKAYLSLASLFAASCINVKDTVDYIKNNNVKCDSKDIESLRLKCFLGTIFNIIPLYKWMRFYDNISSSCNNKNSKYLISYCGMKKIEKGTYKRNTMLPFIEGVFENRKWMLPNNYDEYLTIEYNNYMVIPKQENQKIHPVFELVFDTKDKTKSN